MSEEKSQFEKNTTSDFSSSELASTPSDAVRLENIYGYFPQVSAAPTWTPKTFRDQFAVYKNSTTYRLYVYDTVNKVWRFCALT